MYNNQKVTIITVSHNVIENDREDAFVECLKSVHNQTYKNVEHIVIDGASSDGTVDLIKKYADIGWITYISEPDNGIYDAMTKGVKLSSGEYIYFLNTDDRFFDDFVVEDVVKAFNKEGICAVFGNLFPYLKNDSDAYLKVMTPGKVEKFEDLRYIHNLLNRNIHHQTIFYKTKIFDTCCFSDENFPDGSDWYLHIQAFLKYGYKAKYIDRIIAKFNLGGESTSAGDNVIEQYYALGNKIRQIAKTYPQPFIYYIFLYINVLRMASRRIKKRLKSIVKKKHKRANQLGCPSAIKVGEDLN